MNILILNTFKSWGGGEWWTIALGVGLRSRGHHVAIACPPDSETARRAKAGQLELLPISLESDLALWKIPAIKRYLKENKIEILLCNQTRDVKLGALAGRLAGTPCIFARLGLDIVKKKVDHKIAYTRFIDGIIANTHALKNKYDAFNWFEKDTIRVVHDGIEVPDNIPAINLHARFDLRPGTRTVVAAGRIMPQKGFDLLIDVALMARQRKKPWTILVAGGGKKETELKQRVSSLHLEDYIQFIGFQKDVLPIMKSADVFVLSSRSESMSNVLREAMAVKTACVATNVCGVDELIEDTRSGLIVKSHSAEAICGGLDKVLSDDGFRKHLASNGYRRVKEHFSLEDMVEKIERIFQDALKQSV
jgi:glycosyltransferase involved in cell wall biosynthesis